MIKFWFFLIYILKCIWYVHILNIIKYNYYLIIDKEICNVIMCDIYKDIQAINRPSNDENYLDLSEVIYETIHKALENTISADSAIRTIKKYTNGK